jgi:hypothetical protein
MMTLRDSMVRLATGFIAPSLIDGRSEIEELFSKIGYATGGGRANRAPSFKYGQGLVLFWKGAHEGLKEKWVDAFWSFSEAASLFARGGAVFEADVTLGLRGLACLIAEQKNVDLPSCGSIEDMERWAEAHFFGEPHEAPSVAQEVGALARMLFLIAGYWKAAEAGRLPVDQLKDPDE